MSKSFRADVLSSAFLILVFSSMAQAGTGGAARIQRAPMCPPPSPWRVRASYPFPVYGAAVAADGAFAYAVGGNTIGGSLHSEAYRYDPATDSWFPLASEPFGADYLFHGESGGNGKIYFMGGLTNGTLNRVYDIAANVWTLGAPTPVAVSNYAHAASAGKIYVIGGIVGGAASAGVYAYDVATNTWASLARLPQAEFNMAAGVIDGKIYVAGGSTGDNFITDLYVYDIAGKSWSSGPPMSAGADYPAGTVVSDRLWVIGGGDPFAPSRKAPVPDSLSGTQIFDPTANSWSAGPGLNQARSFADAATMTLPTGGEVALVVGGYDSAAGASLNSVESSTTICIVVDGCQLPCEILPPSNPIVVTDCSGGGGSPVTKTSSWTQINIPPADVILRCPLAQLAGTSGVRVLAHSIRVDGALGGSVSATGTGGIQLTAGSGSGQCNAGATVDLESASVAGANPNGDVKITGCGDVVIHFSNVSSAGGGVSVTSSGEKFCAFGDSFSGSAVTVTANKDLGLHGSTVAVVAGADAIKLVSRTGSVQSGEIFCPSSSYTGGDDSKMSVTAGDSVSLIGACVQVAQNITITAAGNGACAFGRIIDLTAAEIRNDFGQKGVITVTACGGAGLIDISDAILVDNGKSGGGSDPNKVANLNGSLATLPVNCAVATTPFCTTRPLDAADNPVSADPADRAAHNVMGVPRCDS